MDTFQRIAHTFRQDCEEKLHLLEMVSAVIEGSDTIGNALQILFLKSGVYPNDPQQIKTLPDEINRLRVCIESTEVLNIFIGHFQRTLTPSPCRI